MAALAFGACQCMVPIIDQPDAAGAGGGGGNGGDGGALCQRSTCAQDAGFLCRFKPPDAGPQPSCIADTCVQECPGGRSCEVLDAGRCLRCDSTTRCAPDSCTAMARCAFTVTFSSCTGLLDDGAQYSVESQADCRQRISNDAGVLGSWFDLGVGEAVVNIPRLGGYCTGEGLATGAPRMQVYCPFCSFVMLGCE